MAFTGKCDRCPTVGELALDLAPLLYAGTSREKSGQRCERPRTWPNPGRGPTMPNRTCSVEGCDRPHYAKTMCNLHWERMRAFGSTEAPVRPSVEERFWAKVNKNGPIPEHRPDLGPCWIWTGGHSNGYGMFNIQVEGKRTAVRAHQVAYVWIVGSVPPGLVLDHLCDNPPCCNPGHLQATTDRVNILRGTGPSAQHARQTHCKRGHEFTPENTYRPPSKPQRRVCRACTRTGRRAP